MKLPKVKTKKIDVEKFVKLANSILEGEQWCHPACKADYKMTGDWRCLYVGLRAYSPTK